MGFPKNQFCSYNFIIAPTLYILNNRNDIDIFHFQFNVFSKLLKVFYFALNCSAFLSELFCVLATHNSQCFCYLHTLLNIKANYNVLLVSRAENNFIYSNLSNNFIISLTFFREVIDSIYQGDAELHHVFIM